MPEQNNKLLFFIIGLISCCIILLLIVTVKIFISNFKGTKYSNFANYDKLSQDKSIEIICKQANKDYILDWPVSSFYFNTSHNTYLEGAQLTTSGNKTSAVVNAINLGARFIELDVYPDNKVGQPASVRNPQVRHVNVSNSVNLDTHIKEIMKVAFNNTTDPLIIGLEMGNYSDTTHMEKIRDIFLNYIGDKLYTPTLAYMDSSSPSYWPNMKLRSTLGKVIILIPGEGQSPGFENYRDYLRFGVTGFLNDESNDRYKTINKAAYEPNTGKSIWNTITLQNIGVNYSNNPKAFKMKPLGYFSRIYPYNILENTNYNPAELWCYNHNAVALNFSNNTVLGVGNLLYNKFKYSNIVPIDALIQNEKNIYYPPQININDQWGYLYDNVIMDIPYLKSGTIYKNNVKWFSDNGKSELRMQGDGNLVVYNGNGFSTKTGSKNNEQSYLFMQPDGNLVIYKSDKKTVIWKSGTSGNKGAFAYLTNDGKFKIDCDGKNIW